MHDIKVDGKVLTCTESKLKKLRTILPYWGLTLSSSLRITGCLGNINVNIVTNDLSLLAKIRQILSHTQLSLTSNPALASDFEIKLTPDHSHLASILTDKITYHLKPSIDGTYDGINKAIYKNIWLPVRSPGTQVTIHSDYMNHAAEWTAYLILQYTRLTPFPKVTSLSNQDYKNFINEVLEPLNPAFASLQSSCLKGADHWPAPPERFKPSLRRTEELLTLGKGRNDEGDYKDNQLEEDNRNESLFTGHTKKRKDPDNKPFQPFKNKTEAQQTNNLFEQDSHKNPINPFSKKKKTFSTIDPFNNKNS
ncbi:hypothetical protein EV207_16218 [Scopulibacillus darangshiensis]|uniref:Uncharacterized protein n=1 Tax=Scopulibacillus darangshiensis TaxID=442528 RepID=A0A4R2NE52_9BACL|nr:hypothetical protein [Scopulibacillus darangshiensis]TCP19513.1 hypothetical protein EV207_16218 [Scopulibacillus darangshiensis]